MGVIFISYLFNWCVNGFSIMTSFFAEFATTDEGLSCSDSGFRDLSTAQDCSRAVSYAKSFNSKATWLRTTDNPTNHKGCFIYDTKYTGYMYFNTHSTGGRSHSIDTSICRIGNI